MSNEALTIISVVTYGLNRPGDNEAVEFGNVGPTLGVILEVFSVDSNTVSYFSGKAPEAKINIGQGKELPSYSHHDLLVNVAEVLNSNPNAVVITHNRTWGLSRLLDEVRAAGLLKLDQPIQMADIVELLPAAKRRYNYVESMNYARDARTYLLYLNILSNEYQPEAEAACATAAVDYRIAYQHMQRRVQRNAA